MTLSRGFRLGPYEILAPLGAGGMGEVHRARDKKLDRDVAIKVLPESVAADPETLARFEREVEKAQDERSFGLLLIHNLPIAEAVGTHPQFRKLLRGMGL